MKRMTIGRGGIADVNVDDEYVSNPVHARVTLDDDGHMWVEDMGSINGTWVNGLRIYVKVRFYPGDSLRVGRTIIPWGAP